MEISISFVGCLFVAPAMHALISAGVSFASFKNIGNIPPL